MLAPYGDCDPTHSPCVLTDDRDCQVRPSARKPEMNRRRLIAGALALTTSDPGAAMPPNTQARAPQDPTRLHIGSSLSAAAARIPRGPIRSDADGQVIENLDIDA